MIFLDTSAWVALAVPGEPHAARAKALYGELSRGLHGAIVTTDFVLDETVTLTRMTADVPTAVQLARTVLSSPSVTVVRIDREHFAAALELFERHADKRWSLTDCTSFVVMKQLQIQEAFAFDRDFEEAGFSRLP